MNILPLVSTGFGYVVGFTLLILADDPIHTLTILEAWAYVFLAYAIIGTIFLINERFVKRDNGN